MKTNKENLFFYLCLISIILLFVVFQLVLYNKGFFAISADEAGHTLEAYTWYKGGSGLFSIWLPFQKILYGIIFYFYDNLVCAPRIISSVFGLLTLISLMFLTFQLFQNKISTLFAGFLGSIFWGILIFSVLPMTEIYFSFFTITSIAFLIKWQRTKSHHTLLLALIFITIGSMIRYEAWVFSLIIFLVIVIHIFLEKVVLSTKILRVFVITLVLFSFPIIWLYLSYTSVGEIAGFINSVTQRYKPGKTIEEIKNNVIYNFFQINLITLNIIGICAFIFFKKSPEIKLYLFIIVSTLLIYGILTFISKAMPTHNPWRLATVWSILLLPFTAYLFYHLFSSKSSYLNFVFLAFVAVIIFLFISQINLYTGLNFMNKSDIIVGDYIRNELLNKDSASKIFIQESSWEYTNLLISSQKPFNFITERRFTNDSTHFSVPYYDGIKENLKKLNVKYIILKPYNDDYFDLTSLTVIKKFKSWTIYKLD